MNQRRLKQRARRKIERQNPCIPLRPAVRVENHRGIEPGRERCGRAAKPGAVSQRHAMNETRAGSAGCARDPKLRQQKHGDGSGNFAKKIEIEQRPTCSALISFALGKLLCTSLAQIDITSRRNGG